MGYVVPSFKELPLPTLKEFKQNPDFYWNKLREYEAIPYWCHHFGIPKSLLRLFRRFYG